MAKHFEDYLKSQACFFLFLLVLLLLVVPHRCSTVPNTPSRPPSNFMAMFEAAMHEVPSGPNPTSNK
ncbi:hypothetical protein Csa_006135 [Cucumis sativus]|uniref:CLAVATA3/ESR-related protein n=1 Tax=Cucumis sativus TaxID=3659 RepID=A0A0A0LNB8_CUCSA|nr:hypothetical protein Csa_006135 [Cucumis sativus]